MGDAIAGFLESVAGLLSCGEGAEPAGVKKELDHSPDRHRRGSSPPRHTNNEERMRVTAKYEKYVLISKKNSAKIVKLGEALKALQEQGFDHDSKGSQKIKDKPAQLRIKAAPYEKRLQFYEDKANEQRSTGTAMFAGDSFGKRSESSSSASSGSTSSTDSSDEDESKSSRRSARRESKSSRRSARRTSKER
ncbi:hypothetical protein T484DRAFT_1755988 [Baffinella frigidus]|nr:hypothetical protein T484DRAFT_1755988 [Cryptophyta sp. CCMP2293]